MNYTGVVTTFHKDSCKDEWYCSCSEKEGTNIHQKYFKMSGKIEGEYISYWANGNVYSKCVYQNGKIEGERISYHLNGNVEIKCTYQNGKLEGEYISYN